ncbi:uncharacterized protein LOC129908534 [Episyrphus balteatus]|uniref:uncharacterized protein LOC129908534 n=1 Tax=Episyrphus balteatus TaxID=286459 RepID=UPI00248521C1|nr:uncharacterized protein LOC129908534 [Episyrphus balteatus]
MGGCKCTFRTCPVSSLKFPKMTFFHYPLKKDHLINKWIEYADYNQINQMAQSQAKNRAVCALHFKDECFMNYKKNRLTPTAIPTLDRLRTGEVLDYSLGPNPSPISLPPTKDKHLILPEGEYVWGQPPDFWLKYSTMTSKHIFRPRGGNGSFEVGVKPPPSKKPRILNNDLLSVCSSNGTFEIDENTTIALSEEVFQEDNDDDDNDDDSSSINLPEEGQSLEVAQESSSLVLDTPLGIIDIDSEVEFITEEHEVDQTDNEDKISKETFETTCRHYEEEIQLLKSDMETREKVFRQKITELRDELTLTKSNLKVSEEDTLNWKTKTIECTKKLSESETQNQELRLKAKAPPPPPVVIKPANTPSTSTTLTKPQLFNGIKKYLSASMTALVRMEMFGSSERAWKPDEKQVSVELLKLGEKVFKYLKDEWRFRLPPQKMVEEWTNEVVDEDEDDL